MLALRSLDRAIPPRRLPSTQRSLQEAFDRKLSELLRQIRLERRWAIAGHWQTPDGARLVALALEGDAAGRVAVTYADTDGVGWLLVRWGIDRKSGGWGKRVSRRVDVGGGRNIKKK